MSDGADEELQDLADRVGRLVLGGMGARSRWALRAALDAAETEGIAGVMSIKIPGRTKDFNDVGFTIGTVDIVHRWEAV